MGKASLYGVVACAGFFPGPIAETATESMGHCRPALLVTGPRQGAHCPAYGLLERGGGTTKHAIAFILAAGITQSPASRSISPHLAPCASLGRVAVNTCRVSANLVFSAPSSAASALLTSECATAGLAATRVFGLGKALVTVPIGSSCLWPCAMAQSNTSPTLPLTCLAVACISVQIGDKTPKTAALSISSTRSAMMPAACFAIMLRLAVAALADRVPLRKAMQASKPSLKVGQGGLTSVCASGLTRRGSPPSPAVSQLRRAPPQARPLLRGARCRGEGTERPRIRPPLNRERDKLFQAVGAAWPSAA